MLNFDNTKQLVIVIPACEPDHQLINLLLRLNLAFNDFKIIIVDDGSTSSQDTFKRCQDFKTVTLLRHEKNLGKGAALKTAFKYIKENLNDSIIITVDSDGQHKCEDIKKVYNFYLKHPGTLILGSRTFEGPVPKRSSFGNDATRLLLRLCHSRHLNDTQTGLRAFDQSLIDFMLSVKGSRYEYEMNMLSEAFRQNILIREIAIQTVYINENKASHFRPVRDFSRICATILKYSMPLIISMLASMAAFSAFLNTIALPPFIDILFSQTAAFIIFILLNVTGICYGNRQITKSVKKALIAGITFIVSVMISVIVTLNLYFLDLSFYSAYGISLLINLILICVKNYFTSKKSFLYH